MKPLTLKERLYAVEQLQDGGVSLASIAREIQAPYESLRIAIKRESPKCQYYPALDAFIREHLIRADYAVMRDAVYHKYRRWLLTGDGDPDGLLDVMEEVKGYNDRVDALRPVGVSRITDKSLAAVRRNALEPSKAERERFEGDGGEEAVGSVSGRRERGTRRERRTRTR